MGSALVVSPGWGSVELVSVGLACPTQAELGLAWLERPRLGRTRLSSDGFSWAGFGVSKAGLGWLELRGSA